MIILSSRVRGSHRREKFKIIAIVIAVTSVIAGGYFGYKFGKPRYKAWKEAKALREAREYLNKNDAENAKLSLDVALLTSPGSPNAWRVAAELLEQVGANQSIRLRRQVVQLAPDSVEDRAALVTTSLRFRDLPTAREALIDLTHEQANQPVALRAALAYALATNEAPIADALYDRLRAIDPNDSALVLSHATLHLAHPKPERVAAARETLSKLVEKPELAASACRALMVAAITRSDFDDAKLWANRLVALPDATLSDQMHLANLSLLVDRRPLTEVLPPLQKRAVTAPQIAELGRWLIVQRKGADALTWIDTLSSELRASPQVADIRALLLLQKSDWEGLSAALLAGAWGPVPPETIKLAFAARLMADRDRQSLRHEIWDEATASSTTSLTGLRALARLAGQWRWEEESEKSLWAVAKSFPDETWATLALFYAYRQKDKAPSMRELAALLSQRNPGVTRFQYDAALLDILITPNAQWDRPKEVMKHLHEAAPANPSFATGYALSLHQAGRLRDALAVMEAIPESDRALPARAPYLALVYASARKREAAERYIATTETLDMLTEERRLVALAKDALRSIPAAKTPKPASSAP